MGRDDIFPVRMSKISCLLHYVIAYLGYDILHYIIASLGYDIVQ